MGASDPSEGADRGHIWVDLRSFPDAFGAQVLAARLGADGILTELRGPLAGPYPIGSVSVWVRDDDLETARQLVLADEVESAFDEFDCAPEPRRRFVLGLTARQLLAAVALVLIVATLIAGRLVS